MASSKFLAAKPQYREKCPYVVLVKGDVQKAKAPLVRIHSQCLTGDVFASTRCDCGAQLKYALRAIHRAGVSIPSVSI
ncbi:MAG: hypothetical protein L0387_20230 [Acidobacteria bacterium]|nr:hypothetical protein [Acidobacteriota bacterium]MCI0623951.1 hypothetical protein [Acidobacteriota bacterium]